MKPPCRHCGERPAHKARGLCSACYQKPGVRGMYPTGRRPRRERPPCLFCLRRRSHTRGLCTACYYTPGVRELYPQARETCPREPTAEEVEAMVAEQMQCLPPWWPKDAADLRRELERDGAA